MTPRWRLPAFLDARRLEGRIVRFFLVLLLIVQGASYWLVDRALEAQLRRGVSQRLDAAVFNLQQELQRRVPREQSKAAVLAQDKGFVDAVGALHLDEAGPPTLHDALDNLRRRAGAQVVAFVERGGEVQAAPAGMPAAQQAAALAEGDAGEADEGARALHLAVVQGEPMQLVRVPVRVPVSSPHALGDLVLGFSIRPDQLIPIKQYGNVDVAVGLQRGTDWRHAVDAEARSDLAALLAAASRRGDEHAAPLQWSDRDLLARRATLPAAGLGEGERVAALLWVDLEEEKKPLSLLRQQLLALAVAGVALFALGSVFTARRLTGPILALRGFARRLGQGDYETPVVMRSELGEVGALADAFETMRLGIREKQADIERWAYWDRLTGLPNRAQFVERLAAALANPQPLAVLVLNLDRFKPVNDLLGREQGDRLLMLVAERLRGCVPAGDAMLARLGGDEFALYLRGAGPEAAALATALHAALVEPVDLERRAQGRNESAASDGVGSPGTPVAAAAEWLTIDVGASIGVALAPQHHHHPDDLVRMAERAMDLAKHRRDSTLLFEPGMDPRSAYSLSLRSELSRAIQRDELRLFLQPKRRLQASPDLDGQLAIFAAEALVRWHHPERGMVPPGQFIPFAEETGFVRQLTQWVLRATARHAVEAQRRGLSLLLAVNLSTRDLLEVDLLPKLLAMLDEEGCDPGWISLEITESAIMDDPKRALETVQALSRAGFKLAIDDFGTGYSSLAYLQKLPVDEVKIDQSFVFDLETSAPNQTIVRSTIQLAHELGKRVVAEGVETEAAMALLQQWGCDEAQGYYIARPMPAERLIDKLVDGSLETQL